MKRFSMMFMLFATLFVCDLVPDLAAAQQHSNISQANLSMDVGESITVIPPSQAVPLNYTSGATTIPASTFQVTTLWQLASSHSTLHLNWWFASATSALSNGQGSNIPASMVFSNVDGGSFSGCTSAADPLVPAAVSGSTCNVGIVVPLTSANFAGQVTNTIGVKLQGLPLTLAAGTYTGTLNIQAGTN